MADISKIKIGSTTYNIKDATSRTLITDHFRWGIVATTSDIPMNNKTQFTVTFTSNATPAKAYSSSCDWVMVGLTVNPSSNYYGLVSATYATGTATKTNFKYWICNNTDAGGVRPNISFLTYGT